MPVTYNLIASNTLSSSAASVTFSSIPGTYTDLVLKYSVRTDTGGNTDSVVFEFNSDTSTNYSATRLIGDGSTAASARASNSIQMTISYGGVGSTATSNTFSNSELYMPSYLVSQNKPIGSFAVSENNNVSAGISTHAGLWRNTAAITSIKIIANGNLLTGSSFFLYGIKSS